MSGDAETVEMRNWFGEVISWRFGDPLPEQPCVGCGCSRDDHSRVLLSAPCLSCASCSFYVRVVRPDPTRRVREDVLPIIRGESEEVYGHSDADWLRISVALLLVAVVIAAIAGAVAG